MMKPLFYYCILGKIHNIGTVWDKIAVSEEYAIDFAHENINQEPKRFVNGRHFSLEYCLAHSGETINERYRHDRPEDIDLRFGPYLTSVDDGPPLLQGAAFGRAERAGRACHFFVTGEHAELHPDIARRLYAGFRY